MRRYLANAILAGLGLALPLWAFGQTTSMPVIPPVHQAAHAKKNAASAPVWRHEGNTLSVTATGHSGPTVPIGATAPLDGQTHSAGAGVHLTTRPGLTAHANVREIRWAPLAPVCAAALPGAPTNPTCVSPLAEGVQREIGRASCRERVEMSVGGGSV